MKKEKTIVHRELITLYSKKHNVSHNVACDYIGEEIFEGRHTIESVNSEFDEDSGEYSRRGWRFLNEFMAENNLDNIVVI
tara:strand:- start:312 stop:551 length:240 start_codon:yes stop_codon:yes gene_type:complete